MCPGTESASLRSEWGSRRFSVKPGGTQSGLSLHARREAQEYIPAQLYRTVAASAWPSLLGQHRQQMQALSPHQARAQFLGEKESGLRREPWGPG